MSKKNYLQTKTDQAFVAKEGSGANEVNVEDNVYSSNAWQNSNGNLERKYKAISNECGQSKTKEVSVVDSKKLDSFRGKLKSKVERASSIGLASVPPELFAGQRTSISLLSSSSPPGWDSNAQERNSDKNTDSHMVGKITDFRLKMSAKVEKADQTFSSSVKAPMKSAGGGSSASAETKHVSDESRESLAVHEELMANALEKFEERLKNKMHAGNDKGFEPDDGRTFELGTDKRTTNFSSSSQMPQDATMKTVQRIDQLREKLKSKVEQADSMSASSFSVRSDSSIMLENSEAVETGGSSDDRCRVELNASSNEIEAFRPETKMKRTVTNSAALDEFAGSANESTTRNRQVGKAQSLTMDSMRIRSFSHKLNSKVALADSLRSSSDSSFHESPSGMAEEGNRLLSDRSISMTGDKFSSKSSQPSEVDEAVSQINNRLNDFQAKMSAKMESAEKMVSDSFTKEKAEAKDGFERQLTEVRRDQSRPGENEFEDAAGSSNGLSDGCQRSSGIKQGAAIDDADRKRGVNSDEKRNLYRVNSFSLAPPKETNHFPALPARATSSSEGEMPGSLGSGLALERVNRFGDKLKSKAEQTHSLSGMSDEVGKRKLKALESFENRLKVKSKTSADGINEFNHQTNSGAHGRAKSFNLAVAQETSQILTPLIRSTSWNEQANRVGNGSLLVRDAAASSNSDEEFCIKMRKSSALERFEGRLKRKLNSASDISNNFGGFDEDSTTWNFVENSNNRTPVGNRIDKSRQKMEFKIQSANGASASSAIDANEMMTARQSFENRVKEKLDKGAAKIQQQKQGFLEQTADELSVSNLPPFSSQEDSRDIEELQNDTLGVSAIDDVDVLSNGIGDPFPSTSQYISDAEAGIDGVEGASQVEDLDNYSYQPPVVVEEDSFHSQEVITAEVVGNDTDVGATDVVFEAVERGSAVTVVPEAFLVEDEGEPIVSAFAEIIHPWWKNRKAKFIFSLLFILVTVLTVVVVFYSTPQAPGDALLNTTIAVTTTPLLRTSLPSVSPSSSFAPSVQPSGSPSSTEPTAFPSQSTAPTFSPTTCSSKISLQGEKLGTIIPTSNANVPLVAIDGESSVVVTLDHSSFTISIEFLLLSEDGWVAVGNFVQSENLLAPFALRKWGDAFQDSPASPTSVAISGNIALVGLPYLDGTGVVLVFERDSSGEWKEMTGVLVPSEQDVAEYGKSVDVDDRLAVVGGRDGCYTFRLDDSVGWVHLQKLSLDGITWREFPLLQGSACQVASGTVTALKTGRDGYLAVNIYQFDSTEDGLKQLQDPVITASISEAVYEYGLSKHYFVSKDNMMQFAGYTRPGLKIYSRPNATSPYTFINNIYFVGLYDNTDLATYQFELTLNEDIVGISTKEYYKIVHLDDGDLIGMANYNNTGSQWSNIAISGGTVLVSTDGGVVSLNVSECLG